MTPAIKLKLTKIAVVLALLTVPVAQSFGPLVNTANACEASSTTICPD